MEKNGSTDSPNSWRSSNAPLPRKRTSLPRDEAPVRFPDLKTARKSLYSPSASAAATSTRQEEEEEEEEALASLRAG